MNNDLISRSDLKIEIEKQIAYCDDKSKHQSDMEEVLRYSNTSYGLRLAYNYIDIAPTVEPEKKLFAEIHFDEEQLQEIVDQAKAEVLASIERPQGKWIKEDDEHLKGWYRCSECGRRVEDLTDDVVIHAGCEDYTIADIYPYCHCGADMRGGGTNE